MNTASASNHRLRRPAAMALVAAVAVAFGWPTLNGDFLSGDDQRFVVEHYLVNHPSPENAAKLLTILHEDLYQPLPMLSFQLDYARADPSPGSRFPVRARSFHETNLALHAACSVLAMLLATRLSNCRRIGLLAGLMFACHPFALEPVAWISGRMMLLATFFSLATMLACLRRRDGSIESSSKSPSVGLVPTANQYSDLTSFAPVNDPDTGKALVATFRRCDVLTLSAITAWLAAVASKVLPSVPIAALWADRHLDGRLSRRACWTYAILITISIAATTLVYSATERAGFIEGVDAERTTSLTVRAILAAGYYLKNYVFPVNLAAWSPPPENVTFWSPASLSAIGMAIIFFIVLLQARSWNRTAYLGLILFVILLAPFLFAGAGRRFLAADRYMYLPILGLHLAVAATAVSLLDRFAARIPRLQARVLVAVPVMLVLATWMTTGWRLAPVWHDTINRDKRVVQVYPDSALAYAELAKGFNFMGDPDEAILVVESARTRWPENPRLAAAAGDAYRIMGDWAHAKDELQFAASHMPRHLITHYRLGQVYEKLDRPDKARIEFAHVLQVSPRHFPALLALAKSHQDEGNLPRATEYYEQALAISPHNHNARFNLAEILIKQSKWSESEAQLRQILDADPADRPARLNLAVVLANSNRADDSLKIYSELLHEDPDNPVIQVNRAAILSSIGLDAESEQSYRSVLAGDPGNREAAIGLHELLLKQNRFSELPDIWEKYRAIAPNDQKAVGWEAWAYTLTNQLDESDPRSQLLHLHDPFLGWAMAWEAITKGDILSARKRLGPPEIPVPITPARRQEMRAITMALDGLPPATKDAPIGVYALSRAALHGGDMALAQKAANQLISMTNDESYVEGGRLILDAINETTHESPTTSQSVPH